MTDLLVDTNVLIRCLRGVRETIDLLQRVRGGGELHVSVLSRLEVLARTWPHEEERTLTFLSSFLTLPLDEHVADSAGRLLFQQARRGLTLTVPDAIIAATAKGHNLTLVTYDRRLSGMVDGLRVLDL
ncbi:MAG: type II toxin-antitoxin system VapC family toxin [Chloroflexi bacterium]|nr:type II toxin-antitoxin system VapC family toxin [Chloroflexota bacterium]